MPIIARPADVTLVRIVVLDALVVVRFAIVTLLVGGGAGLRPGTRCADLYREVVPSPRR